ncbi:MAG: sigma-70 family RNA polymerase sigma factor [Verrucomicrobia bacterium]|nr:sigma-70 family RNA polymerase sigma factor [Verrucomicrobiota bacterium]
MDVINPEAAGTRAGEADLIARAQSGDEEAFCDLIRSHGAGLLRQATALCGDSATAEDLVQETLVEAWKSVRRYSGRCRLFTWLCSILIHRHRNYLRKRRAIPLSFLFRREREIVEARLSDASDPCLLPSESADAAERAVRVLRSLEGLPARQREVVYLRFYAQDSLEGIAAALGCSVGTVKSRLFNGLERLRRMKSINRD